MSLDQLSSEDRLRLRSLIDQGLKVTQEVQDLREGLKDTIKTIAEELDVKPALLSKAIRIAFKESITAEKEIYDSVEEILHVTGRL